MWTLNWMMYEEYIPVYLYSIIFSSLFVVISVYRCWGTHAEAVMQRYAMRHVYVWARDMGDLNSTTKWHNATLRNIPRNGKTFWQTFSTFTDNNILFFSNFIFLHLPAVDSPTLATPFFSVGCFKFHKYAFNTLFSIASSNRERAWDIWSAKNMKLLLGSPPRIFSPFTVVDQTCEIFKMLE